MKYDEIKGSKLIKVPVGSLTLGMYVSKLDRPWLETPFLLQGFPLNSQADIEALRNCCDFVFIDVLKTSLLSVKTHSNYTEPNFNAVTYPITIDVENEIGMANKHYQLGLNDMKLLLLSVKDSKPFRTRSVRKSVKSCVDSIVRNPSAMMWLTRIKHADSYTAEHCMNVGILAIALGRHLGVSRKNLELLGLCGMLHDVGKMCVDQDILNKPGRLTVEEFTHIKLHPVLGKEILETDPLLPRPVIDSAYKHHERMDGEGYPESIASGSIDFYSKIVSIVDAYDAITSRRCYSKAHDSAVALKILYENRGTQFDEPLLIKFIESVGVYPPGSIVEMNDGSVGFIISTDSKQRLFPRVAILLDENKNPCQQKIIDIQTQRQQANTANNQIKSIHSDGSFGLNLKSFTEENIRLH